MTDALARLDKATQMLAEAKSLDEVKNIMDIAEAARTYARAAKLGLEAQNHAAEICLIAKRKAGEFLSRLDKGTGKNNQYSENTTHGNFTSEFSETIDDAGITPQDATRWQQIANVPEETFQEFITQTKESGKELTQAGALRIAREQNKDMEPPKIPDGKFRVFYADPPWKYGNTMPEGFGEQADHYNLLTVDEISALPIEHMAQDNAVLFLWVTSPILEESFQVVNAWGFKYKSSFIWDKVKHVMGHYNSVRHEILLICTRGSCQPDIHKLFDSVYTEERTEHSKKPEFFREVIDTIYPEGKRIELFARNKTSGWDAWGNDEKLS
jgi:N6-adenosine-specific RNA methylase IME4